MTLNGNEDLSQYAGSPPQQGIHFGGSGMNCFEFLEHR
jgi:hypothetical protein